MTTCPVCGQSIPDNSRFCPDCGTDIGEALRKQAQYVYDAPVYPPQPVVKSRGHGRALAGLILSLIGLGCFAFGTLCVIFARVLYW